MRVLLLGNHSSYHCGSDAVWRTIRRQIAQRAEIVDSWDDCDIVVMNGEGTMHHGSVGFHTKMRLLVRAQAQGYRTYLVNTVWQENPSEYDDVIARLDGLITRGEASCRDLMANHCAPASAALDLSYYEPIDESAPAFDWSGKTVITDIWSQELDFAWLSASFAKDWIKVDLQQLSWSSLVRSLRTADILVTGRHHAMYAAARARLPFVPVRGNSHKFLDLFAETKAPIPICRKYDEIPLVRSFALRSKHLYERLFDAMEMKVEPDLLAPRPSEVKTGIAGFYPPSTLGQMANLRGDYERAGRLWEASARGHKDPYLVRTLAASAYLQGGRIEDGSRLLVTTRSLDPSRPDPGRIIDTHLRAARFWTTPSISSFAENGWASAALSAATAAASRADAFETEAARMLEMAASQSEADLVAARLVLGIRLISMTRHNLAEAFWDKTALNGRPEWERNEDDFRVYTQTSPFSKRAYEAAALVARWLATPQGKGRTDLRALLVQHNWLVLPPNALQAADALAHVLAAPGDGRVLTHALSSCLEAQAIEPAIQIARTDTASFLRLARVSAPVAAFARTSNLAPAQDEAVNRLSAWSQNEENTLSELMDRLADPRRTLAIVGNGPSGLGKGAGAEINDRDEVIRFNQFRTDGRWASDYGVKTTIVFSVNTVRDALVSYSKLAPGTIVGFVTQKRAFLEREWEGIAELEAAGIKVCFPFLGARENQARRLGIYPSTGLMILDQLKRIRPCLSPEDTFGFSFGSDESGRYAYFDNYLFGSEKHEWLAERDAFKALFS